MEQMIMLMVTGLLGGILGAVLGIGGGMIITPILTMLMGLPIQYAIGASIVSVIATSSGATIAYLKDEMLNLRVAMFLEIATTVGAVIGAVVTGLVDGKVLYVLFGALLIFSAFNMIRKMRLKEPEERQSKPDEIATKLRLNGAYFDKATGKEINYTVTNVPGGFAMMFGAGIASGLLGIGSGAFKVIAMDTIMHMPLKPSSATSNLMMGVTAAASATVYYFGGQLQPQIAAPLAIGILIGATVGSRIMPMLPTKVLRLIFIPVIGYMGIQMALKGFVGKVMQIGVVLSALVIILGLLLLLVTGSTGYATGVHPTRVGDILSGTLALKPYAVLMTGIFLLILTPVLRVVVSIYAFAVEHDRLYVWITTIVLIILLGAMTIGYLGNR